MKMFPVNISQSEKNWDLFLPFMSVFSITTQTIYISMCICCTFFAMRDEEKNSLFYACNFLPWKSKKCSIEKKNFVIRGILWVWKSARGKVKFFSGKNIFNMMFMWFVAEYDERNEKYL